ncbi:NAD(P)-binding protein [Congregibacter variabilis]|uniref:NAD(P)-binding protein n=1 Tax=Congregibacter variabilis TaxID=3081200 RepID=A0ABZ0I5P7_9GAMM|nr:NAD(P)-binding protein [Congregibacter sp. IMCC43200]
MNTHKTDYLIIGAGAMGMAFADVLMTESNASITIVDRQHQPGGHWNMAYPFVRLHQPSGFYGVNSRALGSARIDTMGNNKGLYELASKAEICAYYDDIMREFLSSGRVKYFPMCEYQGDGKIQSLTCQTSHAVDAQTVVDATFMNVKVPSMAPPAYEVADSVTCVAPNALTSLGGQWSRYTIIGAGKTSFDACLFLLDNGVSPDAICWIKPRESWLWDRAYAQAGELFETSIQQLSLMQVKVVAESESVEDLFARAEAQGMVLRIDETVDPTMFRCATVTKSEIQKLRSIKNVIRMGRVKHIDADRIELEQGSVDYDNNTLFVDCTADGLARRAPEAVFTEGTITLQAVRTCQQVFSAAFIAHIELSKHDQARKNQLCTPVPHPDSDTDYMRNMLADLINGIAWQEDPALLAWMKAARLDGFSSPATSPEADAAFMQRLQEHGMVAAEKLVGYLS